LPKNGLAARAPAMVTIKQWLVIKLSLYPSYISLWKIAAFFANAHVHFLNGIFKMPVLFFKV
jgi:hypothetical protein